MLLRILPLIILLFSVFPQVVHAQYPTQPSSCNTQKKGDGCNSTNDCFAACLPASGSCQGYTTGCNGTCYCTNPFPQGSCGNWGACSGGLQARWCDTGACSCSSNPGCCDYQLRPCASPTPPGGGGGPPPAGSTPTNTPTPTPVATVQAEAFTLAADPTSCADIQAGVPRAGAVFDLHETTAGIPMGFRTQAAVPVSWSVPGDDTYTLTPPNINAKEFSCVVRPLTGVSTFNGALQQTATGADQITWYMGYSPADAWIQTVEGNVFAAGQITSQIPAVAPRSFSLNGALGYPGIVATNNANYDFSLDPAPDKGADLVSAKKWLAMDSRVQTDFWKYYYQKIGSPTVSDVAGAAPIQLTKPSGSIKSFYYIDQNAETDGTPWTVLNGEKIVFVIKGNLRIKNTVNITPGSTGFIAFIVQGDIIVDPSVGNPIADGATIDIEGVYIANKIDPASGVASGRFMTSGNTPVGKERLVLKGMVTADSVVLQRSLGLTNGSAPAETFIFNPNLLVNMPDFLKDVPYRWQEVAP